MAEPEGRSRLARARERFGPASLLSALLLAVYFALPTGDADNDSDSAGTPDAATDSRKPEILSVKPIDPYPGSSLVITHAASAEAARLHAYAGKEQLRVLVRRPDAIVAQLPSDVAPGDLKIRLAVADSLGDDHTPSERSKPYHVRVKAVRWRKAFRNLAGGIALLLLGIGLLTRGARESTGLDGARRLAQASRRGVPAFALGSLVGVLAQSTTAAAGILASLVGSSVLAVAPAATAYLGAQLGAAAAPLLVSGLVEPHDGLLVIALGALWNGLARDRRAKALARMVLGAGLIAYGLEVLRPGLEPLAAHPMLLSIGDQLRAQGALGVVQCALLGAGLVAVLQGPAPVLMLMLAVAHTTGHRDLRTMLALLAGTGLGAALSALLTTPAGARGRELASLHLVLGAASSAFAAASVPVWSALAERIAHAELAGAGAAVTTQNSTWILAIAFLSSQLTAALLLVPFVGKLAHWLAAVPSVQHGGGVRQDFDVSGVRDRLLQAFAAQRDALDTLFELALTGERGAGRLAEHRLSEAREALEALLRAPLSDVSSKPEAESLASIAFGSLQFQRSLEALLLEVERLTDARVGDAEPSQSGSGTGTGVAGSDDAALREMQELLSSGLSLLAQSVQTGRSIELESARAREIQMNAIESQLRSTLLADQRKSGSEQRRYGLLKVIDGYETAGNQVYRLAELLGELYMPASLTPPPSAPEERYET